jgi:hypothetical protein
MDPGGAAMETARVALNDTRATTSSPGMAADTSASVDPQVSCQGRIQRK